MKRRLLSLLILLCALPSFAQERETIRVGSKLFGGDVMLGYLVLAALEDAGYPVENMTRTGNTSTTRNALLNNQIDIYPEYTGTALSAFFPSISVETVDNMDSESVYAIAASYDSAFHDLVWLEPAPVNDSYLMVITPTFAEQHQLYSLTDFARYVNEGGQVVFATDAEFANRPDGLQAMEQAYGFDLVGSQLLVITQGSHQMFIDALLSGVNGINVVLSNGVDSFIDEYDLVPLYDDQELLLPYEPAPVIRGTLLRRYPEIVTILNPVFRSLEPDVLIGMVARLEIHGEDPYQIARDYIAALKTEAETAEGG